MRALFLALLSANLLFLAWAHWVDAPGSGSSQDAVSRLPRLQLVTEVPPAPKPDPGVVQKMSLRQVPAVALNCTSVGPFNDIGGAARASALLSQRGLKPFQRAEQGETLQGFWVFVGGMHTDEEVAIVVQKLEKSGFTDAHVMKESAEGRRVSVGLFSQRERAERRALAVKHMGLEPQVAERRFPGTVYWVDVGLPPEVRELPGEWLPTEGGRTKVTARSCPPDTQVQPLEPALPVPVPTVEPGNQRDERGITHSLPRTTIASAPKRP